MRISEFEQERKVKDNTNAAINHLNFAMLMFMFREDEENKLNGDFYSE